MAEKAGVEIELTAKDSASEKVEAAGKSMGEGLNPLGAVTAALNGELDKVEYVHDEVFNVDVPTSCPNVPSELLAPRNTWQDKAAYDKAAKDLAARFRKNFEKYDMPQSVIDAGPRG